jgi:hypothetical protein
MPAIQQFVVEVRVTWSKNTLEGFLIACNNLVMEKSECSGVVIEENIV